MKRLIEVPVSEGADKTVLVEVEEDVLDVGLERAARRGEVTGRAAKSMAEAVDDVRPAVDDVVRGLLQWPVRQTNSRLLSGSSSAGRLEGSSRRRRARAISRYR